MRDIITVGDNDFENTRGVVNSSRVFRMYNIKGIYPEELDAEGAYKITKAYLKLVPGKKYLLGWDIRKSSKIIADAVIQAILEEGLQIDSLGEVTTDNLYFGVGKYDYDGGIMITASQSAAKFNGLIYVKKNAEPILTSDLKIAYNRIEEDLHYLPLLEVEPTKTFDCRDEFINSILESGEGVTFVARKIVIDASNGMAGKLLGKWQKFHRELEIVPMYFESHADFPHHEPDPLNPLNLQAIQERIQIEKADFGVIFDGDASRAFFLNSSGELIPGYYILAALAEYFLKENKGAAIVYDLSNTRAIESIIKDLGGRALVAQTGPVFLKKKLLLEDGIFAGASTTSHFMYRANYFSESGLLTLELVLKILALNNLSLEELIKKYSIRFASSGEQNFYLKDKTAFPEIVKKFKAEYSNGSFSEFDGFIIDYSNWRFSLRMSNTEPFLRLNIEADSKGLLEEKQAALFNIIEEYAEYTSSVSNVYDFQTLHYSKRKKLEYLFSNLHYTWNPYKANYLDELYGDEWSKTQTPIDLLRIIDQPILDKFYEKHKLNIEESIRMLQTYLEADTWYHSQAKNDKLLAKLQVNPIAYFSLEFCLTDWLQIYSGGLGVLAGDTLKEASDSGLPLVAIGLFYSQGYFYQRFTPDGWQMEDYLPQDADDYPMETVKDQNGLTLILDIKIGDHIVKTRVWRMKVGRRSLLMLDTNFNENKDMVDRMITYHLYGGDQETRIKQEIILAMGGYQVLKAIGIKPSILHLNEGHSAFTVIAQAKDIMLTEGVDFNSALTKSRKNIAFTNHTLKQAGNDVFPYALVEKYLGPYAQELGVEFRTIFALGVDPLYAEGKFGMTILGLNNAAKINAVSELHATAATKIWPDHPMVPVTNGAHLGTWVSQPIHDLLDEYVGEKWSEQGSEVDWKRVNLIPESKLWQAHVSAKNLLRKNLLENCGVDVPENSLIFAWFRRLAAYKQPEVLTLDLDRLERLINNSPVPVRFVFGGKAHPQDKEGKELLKQVYQVAQQPRFKDKLIIIPDYNWRMAKFLVSGSDVWVNSPVRLQEACGTSGMKAGSNGLLQFSTYDGWVDEVKDTGIILPINDVLDANQYYSMIEQTILPMYQNRNEQGVPVQWVQKMKATMEIILSHYGTDRMLRDYVEKVYRPLLKDNND